MKKAGIVLVCLAMLVLMPFSCIIQNPQPDQCEVIEITVTDIHEGSSYDIFFKDSGSDRYYINRGLEQGLEIEILKSQVLNKKVKLHLPILLFGTSNHISQLAVGDEVIFTEFNDTSENN